jgi:hypothetical protein
MHVFCQENGFFVNSRNKTVMTLVIKAEIANEIQPTPQPQNIVKAKFIDF